MKTQTTIFSFESSSNIRAVEICGSPWFVATDVCNALHLSNPTMSLKALDEDERSKLNLGRQGEASIISESGLYTLILRCRDAVTPGTIPYRFRKWVTAEVLPAIRQTGQYHHRVPEVLGDLAGTALPNTSTMTVRDARRGKKITSSKAATRIADACVPMIMEAMRDQYHYANSNVGLDEVIPALLSEERNLQITALVEELADNGHNVAGVVREVEVMRYYILQCAKNMAAIATHAAFIAQQAKVQ
ncbi:anti-repressor protein [Serratia grimesii]|uniref:Anti-repressor protein n=1 Tax=Serratia grimesii TaxID=82995 RepID=A0ABR4UC74_9GAMM|nr:anti-repressor protein [Serratia grimesii]